MTIVILTMKWLLGLGILVFNFLHNLAFYMAEKLRLFSRVVWSGGSKGIVKKRTGNVFLDKLSSAWFGICQRLDKLDTRVLFRGRPYQAKACRVRSSSEKQVANWLTDHGIKFQYEAPLRLGKVTLHPDFFLTNHNIYVEYWGLVDVDSSYRAKHFAKLRLYEKHNIVIISLYPKHLKQGLDSCFEQLFRKATDRQLLQQIGKDEKCGGMEVKSIKWLVLNVVNSKILKKEEGGNIMKLSFLSVIGLCLVIAVGALFVFAPWSKDAAEQAIGDANNAFRDGVRDENLALKAGQEIEDYEAYLRTQYGKLAKAKQAQANQEATRDNYKARLAEQEELLTKAMTWIESHAEGDVLEINGRKFEYAMVATDALTRADKCEGLRQNIELVEVNIQTLSEQIDVSDREIASALADAKQKRGELETKNAQLAALRTVKATKDMASDLRVDQMNIEGVSNRANQEIDRRITELKSDLEFDQLNETGAGVVPWNDTTSTTASDLDAVRAYQQKHMGKTPELEEALGDL